MRFHYYLTKLCCWLGWHRYGVLVNPHNGKRDCLTCGRRGL